MQGWIKLHRELTEKAIWTDSTPEQKTILITLLTMANHKEKEWEFKGERYKAEAGQFVTSLPSIVRKSGKGITSQNVRTALKRFEKYEFLTDESTNKNRLITIVNWGLYQQEKDRVTDELTGNQQAANRQLTANKNVKNDKNVKKEDPVKQIKDLLVLYSDIENFNTTNNEYWDVIKETRKHGKVAKSVIINTMTKWSKYEPKVVEYALKEHVKNHKTKREEYTLGIMRGTTLEEVNRPKEVKKPKERKQIQIEPVIEKWRM